MLLDALLLFILIIYIAWYNAVSNVKIIKNFDLRNNRSSIRQIKGLSTANLQIYFLFVANNRSLPLDYHFSVYLCNIFFMIMKQFTRQVQPWHDYWWKNKQQGLHIVMQKEKYQAKCSNSPKRHLNAEK